MGIKVTIPNTSSDTLTFGSANTTTAAQIAGIDSGSSNGQLAFYTTASGTSTERVRVDSSGNVGIGTTSPSYLADIGSSSGTVDLASAGLRIRRSGVSTCWSLIDNVAGVMNFRQYDSATPIIRWLNSTDGSTWTERMRIDSSGNLLVGTTSNTRTAKFRVYKSGDNVMETETDNAGTGFIHIGFINPNGRVGNISTNASATVYNTISDYRLKENISPMTGALAKVTLLKPVTYKWKVDGSDGQGFIAHELAEVVSGCVTGEKDAVDAEGNPVYQGIDTSFLVATLTAAIQELNARLTALENK